jgi:predicted dithiol-disulfide oxidoreductase (DUF899 family)
MTDHTTGTREEWLAARVELLEREKEHTRLGDDLARRRRELPWVRVEKDYQLETEAGTASLATGRPGPVGHRARRHVLADQLDEAP